MNDQPRSSPSAPSQDTQQTQLASRPMVARVSPGPRLFHPPAAETACGPIAEAARAFPVAGAIVGLIGSGIYLLAMELGLSGLLAALLAVAATVIVGGALHEDGLADFADMLGVRGDRERKLGVMRDSRIGSYGVLALGFSTAIKVGALVGAGRSARWWPAPSSPPMPAAGRRCPSSCARCRWRAPTAWRSRPASRRRRDLSGPRRRAPHFRLRLRTRRRLGQPGGRDRRRVPRLRSRAPPDRRLYRRRARRGAGGRAARHPRQHRVARMTHTVTRWWLVRHAPVIGVNGRVYGQDDIDSDCGDETAVQAPRRHCCRTMRSGWSRISSARTRPHPPSSRRAWRRWCRRRSSPASWRSSISATGRA